MHKNNLQLSYYSGSGTETIRPQTQDNCKFNLHFFQEIP